jgi:hypothetical protein
MELPTDINTTVSGQGNIQPRTPIVIHYLNQTTLCSDSIFTKETPDSNFYSPPGKLPGKIICFKGLNISVERTFGVLIAK